MVVAVKRHLWPIADVLNRPQSLTADVLHQPQSLTADVAQHQLLSQAADAALAEVFWIALRAACLHSATVVVVAAVLPQHFLAGLASHQRLLFSKRHQLNRDADVQLQLLSPVVAALQLQLRHADAKLQLPLSHHVGVLQHRLNQDVDVVQLLQAAVRV